MGHDKLANHIKTQFSMVQHHKWSFSDLENMLPWERYIYVELLQQWLREEEKRLKEEEQELKAYVNSLNRRK